MRFSKNRIKYLFQKCVDDIKDADGNVIASGRNCPAGKRKKREVIDSLEEMQRRLKRVSSYPNLHKI